MDVRSIASESDTRCHVRPSSDNTTLPRGPTSQQIVGAGAAPAVNVAGTPVDCVCHVVPPSIERSTLPPVRILQRTVGFGDTMSVGTTDAFANACARALGVAPVIVTDSAT